MRRVRSFYLPMVLGVCLWLLGLSAVVLAQSITKSVRVIGDDIGIVQVGLPASVASAVTGVSSVGVGVWWQRVGGTVIQFFRSVATDVVYLERVGSSSLQLEAVGGDGLSARRASTWSVSEIVRLRDGTMFAMRFGADWIAGIRRDDAVVWKQHSTPPSRVSATWSSVALLAGTVERYDSADSVWEITESVSAMKTALAQYGLRVVSGTRLRLRLPSKASSGFVFVLVFLPADSDAQVCGRLSSGGEVLDIACDGEALSVRWGIQDADVDISVDVAGQLRVWGLHSWTMGGSAVTTSMSGVDWSTLTLEVITSGSNRLLRSDGNTLATEVSSTSPVFVFGAGGSDVVLGAVGTTDVRRWIGSDLDEGYFYQDVSSRELLAVPGVSAESVRVGAIATPESVTLPFIGEDYERGGWLEDATSFLTDAEWRRMSIVAVASSVIVVGLLIKGGGMVQQIQAVCVVCGVQFVAMMAGVWPAGMWILGAVVHAVGVIPILIYWRD